MNSREIRTYFAILISAYLNEADLRGPKYEIIDDDLQVKVNYFKPIWISKLFRAYRTDPMTNICKLIANKMLNRENINQTLLSEIYGFIRKAEISQNRNDYHELIIRLLAIHTEMESYRTKKQVIVMQKPTQKYIPVYSIENVTPFEVIPVKVKGKTFALNVAKFLEKFQDVDWGSNESPTNDPQVVIQIKRRIEESADDINDIGFFTDCVSKYL